MWGVTHIHKKYKNAHFLDVNNVCTCCVALKMCASFVHESLTVVTSYKSVLTRHVPCEQFLERKKESPCHKELLQIKIFVGYTLALNVDFTWLFYWHS